MKHFIAIICLTIGAFTFISRAESPYRAKSFSLFVSGKIAQWESLIDTMLADPDFHTFEDKEELLSYYYGLIGHLIDTKEKKRAHKVLDKALQLLNPLLRANPYNGRLLGLKANLQGFQIILSPLKAPTLAHNMLQNAKKAEKFSPEDPDVKIWSANILFYMPNAFGGDTQLSRKYYNEALKMYEADESLRRNNWMYLQLIITLGLVEEKEENYKAAHTYFTKAMQLYPEYPHLKNVLYPRILDKIKNT